MLPTPKECKKYTDTNITDLGRMTNSTDFSDTTRYKFLNITFLKEITQNIDFMKIIGNDVIFIESEIIKSQDIIRRSKIKY